MITGRRGNYLKDLKYMQKQMYNNNKGGGESYKNKIMKMAFKNPLAKGYDASEYQESILNVSKDLCI